MYENQKHYKFLTIFVKCYSSQIKFSLNKKKLEVVINLSS